MDASGVIGVLLAAGQSRRMGRNKLNLPFGPGLLGSCAFGTALESKLSFVFTVTNGIRTDEWLSPFLKNIRWKKVSITEGATGQSESLKAGLREAEKSGAEAIMILLADQPFISTAMLNQLLAAYKQVGQEWIVSAADNGICKPPVIFSKKFFSRLATLEGDQGARNILRHHEKVLRVELPAIAFRDIDTWKDYLIFKKEGGDEDSR
ncbi:NTP transferase domain-containing protein [Neobacillus terrae]|uniref:NTP transferase domain-containing protein n=1 Tax=Neobacillus terrae TaxID=3034837 RepID=UPI00140BB981|nr:NTP transferase domain-containing protein [Neobacillus terrae]